MLTARCPLCEKRYRVPKAEAGQPVVCIACGSWFAVLPPLLPPWAGLHHRPLAALDLVTAPKPMRGADSIDHDAPHEVTVVRADRETRGAFAAVACAVLLLGTFGVMLYVAGHSAKSSTTATTKVDPAARAMGTLPATRANDTNPTSKPPRPNPLTAAPTTTLAIDSSVAPKITTDVARSGNSLPLLPTTNLSESSAPAPTKVATLAPPAGPTMVARPPAVPILDAQQGVSDAQIGVAIQRGVDYLITQFDPNDFEILNDHGARTSYHTGMDALCVYALLQAGQATNDPRLSPRGPLVTGILDQLKRMPITANPGDRSTYAHALRAAALAVYDRQTDHEFLRRDALWLIRNQRLGAYTYSTPQSPTGAISWDNSNSQYGLLGVWAAAEAGIEVPNSYWTAVEKHWNDCQLTNGGWEYVQSRISPGSLSMTCAGIASLFVCHDWIDTYRMGTGVGREPFTLPLSKGITWLQTSEINVNFESGFWGYVLYGLERVGLASGYKYFGAHNWYPELCKLILEQQNREGSFGSVYSFGYEVNSSYALLFLSRGRHPILMNKLKFDGYWANRPRDLSNLSRVAGRELERPLNWQVVPLERDWTDWTDAPVLYLASHESPRLDPASYEKLRNFALAGGMLFLHADSNSAQFDRFARALASTLFSEYPLVDVPADHPLFASLYPLRSPPPLKMVSNGSRILLLYSPQDLAQFWQTRDDHSIRGKLAYELGTNIFVYAAGKRDLRNRLQSTWVTAPASSASYTIPIARVQYSGNWDPEPAAWPRFSNWLARQSSYGLDISMVPLKNLQPARSPFAHMTGTAAFIASDEEVQAVRRYVEAGGVLFIDTTGGAGNFNQSLRADLLSRAFPGVTLDRITPDHPLLAGSEPGTDKLARPYLRPFAIDRLGGSTTAGPSLLHAGRGHVIVTPADVTSGLLGTNTWGVIGYDPAYAQSLMKNAILWTLDGQKDEQ